VFADTHDRNGTVASRLQGLPGKRIGRGSSNSRNGTRAKTVLSEIGPVEIEVPRDTNSSFEPQIVKKHQRRLSAIDEPSCL
jgi:transposase-like protein